MAKRAERRDERTYSGRNTYPKWAYVDQYGERKYAYTRARAREYNKASGIAHPYHQETVYRFHRQEYEEERARILGQPTGSIDIVRYDTPGEYAASFGRSRLSNLDSFIHSQQQQLTQVYRLAYNAGDSRAQQELQDARDAANGVVTSRAFTTEAGRTWKRLAAAMAAALWFLAYWDETGYDHSYWYWSNSVGD